MPDPSMVSDISHVIELAVAPVFLLAGIGAFINAFAGRLARIVDRSRKLEDLAAAGNAAAQVAARVELNLMTRRARLVYLGISFGIASALSVCLVIVSAFLGLFVNLDLAMTIGVLFIVAILLLIAALLMFLREVFLAVRHMTFGGKN
ncbi:MAG: DUF2721 domain-containing protein [Chromatiales bacterium]|jgi:hypothetical protein|nr:DUF2721 domain-containing protein [Chromatiales bacterium]MDX9765762.1 DUF2721 domain-containing protein [Ectothiorhodospiraceae bacterium]